MSFPQRLADLRKKRRLTQNDLADTVGINVSQIRRYEAGSSQPTLDVLRKLAIALNVSADVLVFEKEERGPDETLRYQFEAVCRLDSREKEIVMEVLDGLLLKHDARRWITTQSR
jgi:transcriptional regulator with XRE-family HTH domain